MRTALGLVVKVVRYEVRLWYSLYRWVFRRPVASGPGAQPFRYTGTLTAVILAFIGVSAVELPVLHFLLPWETVRFVADLISVYSLLWMIGLLASVRVNPHVVSDDGIRIRNGLSVDIAIAWEAVASVRGGLIPKPAPRSASVEDDVLSIGILSQTNVEIKLREPTTFAVPKLGPVTVTEVRLYADDPAAFTKRVQATLAVAS